jgi:hypothetical protein
MVRGLAGRVELFVGRGFEEDHGIVRLDKSTREYLKLKIGDEVRISSIALSLAEAKAKVAEALVDDEGKSIVRIADDKMHEGSFKVGMRVFIESFNPL